MSMSRRSLLVAAATGAAWTFCPSALAFDNCREAARVYRFRKTMESGVPHYAFNVEPWDLGDCRLSNGLLDVKYGTATFFGEVSTRFTHRKDIWHLRVQMFFGDKALADDTPSKFFDQTFDGPEMSEKDPGARAFRFYFAISPDFELERTTVRLTSCC